MKSKLFVKTIRNVAITCMVLTVLFIIFAFLTVHGKLPFHFQERAEEMNALEQMEYYSSVAVDDYQLSVVLPDDVQSSDIRLAFNYVTRKLEVDIDGISENYFFENHLTGGTEYISKVTYIGDENSAGFYAYYKKVFEFDYRIDNHVLYINATDPHEIYDYIVVIDAGHGGDAAPGTVWKDVRESDIDLAIAQKLEKLLENSDRKVGVYMTRTMDRSVALTNRVDLANALNADAFISIHNNTNGLLRMDDTSGTEVLYNELDESGQSYRFAQICQKQLVNALDSYDRGVKEGSENIQIIRDSEVPVALVEVGFMSNAKELEKLTDGSYQAKAAQALYEAIMATFGEGL